jgi:hypothetical protein
MNITAVIIVSVLLAAMVVTIGIQNVMAYDCSDAHGQTTGPVTDYFKRTDVDCSVALLSKSRFYNNGNDN